MTASALKPLYPQPLWIVCVAAAWAIAFAPATAANLTNRGKALVEDNCARCHAIGRTGKSTHPDAPPFRTLSQRYPLDSLEEALAEGISTGHPDMPEFTATPDQISAILDYIGSLQKP
ncbi:cytochrome c [Mesorhizobium sp. YR577]|uniref:c-type cytochrome n=1 Tax=Mesorhizobium sp. YR577 TaxID=1884373 RepID=UPI0008E6C706|nr:cytochrome c [Mesorhizobium sp. YR577]SFU21398.1 Cytochrome C oxidase, cbb3-type, subunit III [Mesorhizobium sp. YR577]